MAIKSAKMASDMPVKSMDVQGQAKSWEHIQPICPCLSTKALHVGGCLFAATTIGSYYQGILGAAVGAVLGLAIGITVINNQSKTPT
jgi:hypothetical protein